MTTQLPEPDFTLDMGDEPCYYASTLSSYGSDEYKRGIADACDAMHELLGGTVGVGLRLEQIRKPGETL